MREIRLTNSDATCLVSDDDYEFVTQFRWCLSEGYVIKTSGSHLIENGKRAPQGLHRIIVMRMLGGDIPKGLEVDHEDRSKLNNTRDNLRVCTKAQNMANIGLASYSRSSQYKGVARQGKKWTAQISEGNQKSKYLGSFNDERAAASAYNRAALERFGEFAVLNDVPSEVEDTPNPPRFHKKKGSSQYRGVCRDGRSGKWIAQFQRGTKSCYLGLHATEEEAARAWDRKARELFGDAAPLNFPDEVER